MKPSRLIVIISILAGLHQVILAQVPEKPDRKDAFQKISNRTEYGKWLDEDGFLTPGPKTADFVDNDRDSIDDRRQSAPGKPAGKLRPDKQDLKDKTQPEQPTIPHKDDNSGSASDKPSVDRPDKPSRPALSSDLKEQLTLYKTETDALRAELKTELNKLNKPTREQIRKLTSQFQEQNKERLAKQKELADKIKSELSKVRPTRPSKPSVSPETASKVSQLRQAHGSLKDSVAESKKELKIKLESASVEEREALLDKFREDQKKLHGDIKNVQQKIRELMDSSLVSSNTSSGLRDKPRRRPPVRENLSKTGERRNSDR